jgi:hypothetical protein
VRRDVAATYRIVVLRFHNGCVIHRKTNRTMFRKQLIGTVETEYYHAGICVPIKRECNIMDDEELHRAVDERIRAADAGISLAQQLRIMSWSQHLADGTANPMWLEARKGGMITGSVSGAINGDNPYSNADMTLHSMLWNTFRGNDATRYGNKHEDECQAAFVEHMKTFVGTTNSRGQVLRDFRIYNPGLVVSRTSSRFGMSPDGVLELRFAEGDAIIVQRILLEYKCPYRRRSCKRVPRDMYKRNVPFAGSPEVPVPPYYMAQLHHGMSVLGTDGYLTGPWKSLLVVWAPLKYDHVHTLSIDGPSRMVATTHGLIQITSVPYAPSYGARLRASLDSFYETQAVPAFVLKDAGCLEQGELAPFTRLG